MDCFLLFFKKINSVFCLLSHQEVFLLNAQLFVLFQHAEGVLDRVKIFLNVCIDIEVLLLLFLDQRLCDKPFLEIVCD